MSRLYASHWKDYELLDAGGDKKLERWGNVITIRPERNAYFRPVQTHKEWRKQADFEFVEETHNKGEWKILNENAPKEWEITFKDVTLKLKLTRFKHLGIFPEQQANWEFIEKHIQKDDRFLNLFGYTGASSLVARAKGADVFHCDSVKQVINWGRENMELSNLNDIHWVLEDALKFAQREVKRGRKYKGIIMDPPAFGLGAKKERWKIENLFTDLVEQALQLKEENGFIILNTYSPRLTDAEIMSEVRRRTSYESVSVETLSIKSVSGKVVEYSLRTLIQ